MNQLSRKYHIFTLCLTIAFIFAFKVCYAESELRRMKYTTGSSDKAKEWQTKVRKALFEILKLDDLIKTQSDIPLNPKLLKKSEQPSYVHYEYEINSTPARRFNIILTVPNDGKPPFPAVVCVHGHGGTRYSVYDKGSIYKGFASHLAEQGYVTIAADVGQHKVYEEGRILMGERLWDLMRCVDFLIERDDIDPKRIGCAGLSLGGEMTMWLGAMDTRVSAVVSSGFLTVMDQMEQNHCMCWKFNGLRELVDYADIYSLIAPRPLMCQNGLKEGPKNFYVPIAKKAMKDIKLIYQDLGKPDHAVLDVHPGGHEIHLPTLMQFFEKHLK